MSTTNDSTSPREQLTLLDCGEKKFGVGVLKQILPDIETALFFAKVYDLTFKQLGALLSAVFDNTVVQALQSGDHSTDLQSYIVSTAPPALTEGVKFSATVQPPDTVLPLLWEMHEVVVADSIKEVGAALVSAFERMPGTVGTMEFNSLAKMHKQRRTIGDYRAGLTYKEDLGNLLILDVSASMSRNTVSRIIDDVVGLAMKADAHLVVVSNTAYHWAPGDYSVEAVMRTAEFSGTHYEMLAPLFETQRWGQVITVADYDSSYSAFEWLRDNCSGHINEVIDISLVNKPTFLAECVGQFADKVTPILVSARSLVRG